MAAPDEAGDRALVRRLAGQRVLFCYGLLGEVIAGLRPLGMDYMGTQADWLRGLGIAVEVVALPTAAPVEANAQRIAAAIMRGPGPAVIVAHSKGGVEALAALLRPEVAAMCRGFIALQSPFYGSPVADAVCGRRPLHQAAHHLLQLARLGNGLGLLDLTTPVRAAWMRNHAEAIAALVARVPVITLATVLAEPGRWQDRPYWPLARWMERRGAGPNDGLVPLASARIPGVPCLRLPGGHRAMVARGPGRDPVGLLRTRLLAMLPEHQAAEPDALSLS